MFITVSKTKHLCLCITTCGCAHSNSTDSSTRTGYNEVSGCRSEDRGKHICACVYNVISYLPNRITTKPIGECCSCIGKVFSYDTRCNLSGRSRYIFISEYALHTCCPLLKSCCCSEYILKCNVALNTFCYTCAKTSL